MYYLINQKNDLQSIVEKKHPKIKKLIKSLTETKGCYFSRITGSGSHVMVYIQIRNGQKSHSIL